MVPAALELFGTDVTVAVAAVATAVVALTTLAMGFLALAPAISNTWQERLGAAPSGEDFGLETREAD